MYIGKFAKPRGTDEIRLDCQQNQPLPKLSVCEIIYSRLIRLFELNIMKHNSDGKQKIGDGILLCLVGEAEIAFALSSWLKDADLECHIPGNIMGHCKHSELHAAIKINTT